MKLPFLSSGDPGYHHVIVPLLSLVFLICGCKSQKVVAIPEEITVLDNTDFYRSGLTEISGKLKSNGKNTFSGSPKWLEKIYIFTDDIITDRQAFRGMAYDPDSLKLHNWVRIPTPRIASIRGSKVNPIDLYLEGGRSLDFDISDETGDINFSGELGRINREIAGAPVFREADRITGLIETDSNLKPEDARKMYDNAFEIWRDSLSAYIFNNNISEAGKRILGNQPLFQKAFWLMLHEKFLKPTTPEDYSPLRDALLTDDNYLMAQKWPGGLVKNLASSDILKRLAENIHVEKDSTLKGAILKYMRRYDALSLFLGITGVPQLSQLAVARVLCAGGFLKRARTVDEAVGIVDAVADKYIPNPEIKRIAREYALNLFKKNVKSIPDNPEGKMLKELLAKYKGKNVIMDFWNHKCPPCIREMRDTRELREKYRDNPDWVILYVAGEEETPKEEYEKIRKKYLEGDETLLLNHDIYGRLTAMFDVEEIPRKVFFDREGNILDEYYKFDPSNLPK